MSARLLSTGIALAFAAFAGDALACSCERFRDAASQLARAELAVLARAEWSKPDPRAAGSNRQVTRFQVLRTIKGEARAVWEITHGVDGGACGVVFKPGEEYLVLAEPFQGQMATMQCLRPFFPIADYKADVRN